MTTLEILLSSFISERDNLRYGVSLWSAGVSCPGCVSSQPLVIVPPAYLLGAQSERQRWAQHSASTDQQWLKQWCVINTVLITRLKQSTRQTAMEKMKSIPAKPSTHTKQNKAIPVTEICTI